MSFELIQGGATNPPPVIKKAGAIILLGRSLVVLVRPHDGSTTEWVLPKGHVEEGETSIQTAMREALEETGAVVHPIKPEDFLVTLNRTYQTEITADGDVEETESVDWYLAQAVNLLTEKITDHYIDLEQDGACLPRQVGIFPPLVALAKLTHEEHRKVLAQAISGESQ